MSLKYFHIVFILASDALALGLGIWTLSVEKNVPWAAASFVTCLLLNVYLVWFLIESKKFPKP